MVQKNDPTKVYEIIKDNDFLYALKHLETGVIEKILNDTMEDFLILKYNSTNLDKERCKLWSGKLYLIL